MLTETSRDAFTHIKKMRPLEEEPLEDSWNRNGTGMKTEAMVSRAHSHGPSELSESPELLVVTSGR